MMATLSTLVPFARPTTGAASSSSARATADCRRRCSSCFPRATLVALDGSESMRAATTARTGAASAIARAWRRSTLATRRLVGVALRRRRRDLRRLTLHHLNDAKKQYRLQGGRRAPLAARRAADRGSHRARASRRPVRSPPIAWDASARAQADAIGAPDQFERFVDATLESLPFSRRRRSSVGALPSPGLAASCRLSAVDCWWLIAGHAVFGAQERRVADVARRSPRARHRRRALQQP